MLQFVRSWRKPTNGSVVIEATIGPWFKYPGDAVVADEAVVELETDKVTIDVVDGRSYAPCAHEINPCIDCMRPGSLEVPFGLRQCTASNCTHRLY